MAVHKLETSYEVAGVTPQQCFDYLADVDNAGEWNTFVRSATTNDPPGLGRKVDAKIHFILSFPLTATVTTSDEPNAYGVTTKAPFEAELGARFRETADGTMVESFLTMDAGKFFPVPKVVLRRLLQAQFDKDVKLMQQCFRGLA